MDNIDFQARRAEDLMCPIRDGKNCRGRRCAWCITFKLGETKSDMCSITAAPFLDIIKKHYNADIMFDGS